MDLKAIVERIRGGLSNAYISTAINVPVEEVKKIRDILNIDKNLYGPEISKITRLREKKEVAVRAIKMGFSTREIRELTYLENYKIEEIRETIDINNNLYFCTLQLKTAIRKKEKIETEEYIMQVITKSLKKGMSPEDIRDITDCSIDEIEIFRKTLT